MSRFLKRDPIKRAKKCVEKALEEIEAGFPVYASFEYEKAAGLFMEDGEVDFAVKYFREAAYAALESNDHIRTAEMKMLAADALLVDSQFDVAGGLFSEASDHQYRENRANSSAKAISTAILSYLAARNFDTAINLQRKAEKRFPKKEAAKLPGFELAQLCVAVLCEGKETTEKDLKRARSSAKVREPEVGLFDFVINSVSLALQTEVTIEWAGEKKDEVSVKSPLEFELRYSCPVPVRVVDKKYNISKSLKFTNEPVIEGGPSSQDSWLLEVTPVLSGDGSIGPFSLTLEGDQVLVNKISNVVEFGIQRAPSDLTMELTPQRISCGLGDETVFNIVLKNEGDGPADNIKIQVQLSDGLEVSLGSNEKTIQFIGPSERMMFQIYVRGVSMGSQLVTVLAVEGRTGKEIIATSQVDVA
ncbi:MAG: hypothetical protein EAX95_06980 [Candidatus Thorarchaeota archaeon]|nr:hypothetical protein [Candidatus Thorarchaeota archaeon]